MAGLSCLINGRVGLRGITNLPVCAVWIPSEGERSGFYVAVAE